MMIKKLSFFWIFLYILNTSFAQESYYNDVNLHLTGIDLKEALATKIISSHTYFLTYSQIWDASKVTDVNPLNSNQVLLIYGWENGADNDVTNDRERALNSNGGNSGDWNREHVFSRSLGTPNLGELGPGSDAHHLRPSDVQRNSSRGNRKFSNGTGNSGATSEIYIDALDGSNSAGWYPGDEWKGDVARMMMYMYLRYGNRCLPSNVGLGSTANTPDDMIDLFLLWNVQDPVSDFERQRNTYHENTLNPFAQGNRNPFIDNPILATRIWDGPKAEDSWGIYSGSDLENPSTPQNITVTNTTTFSMDISWNAATDNIAVTSYDVFIDGKLQRNTTHTFTTITGLKSDTSYSITVLAKDMVNNTSEQSKPILNRTLKDIQAPSIPTNITISNQTGTTFKVSWDAATDDTAVTEYHLFVNTIFTATTKDTTYTATNLSVSTTYAVQVLAKDEVGNTSALSNVVNASTTDGSTTTANELFFSEYIEGSGNNKAVEIANFTNSTINLREYSIKRQSSGGKNGEDWDNTLVLSGSIEKGSVFTIINGNATNQKLITEADIIVPAFESPWGAPINFNGDDPVGLFKNDVLIDIIGTYNSGGGNFAENKTLRRKSDVSQPNTAFDITNEWDVFPIDTVDDFGKHNSTLNTQNYTLHGIKFFPNPIKDKLQIINPTKKQLKKVSIYTILGKKIFEADTISSEIDLTFLSKGMYIINFEADTIVHTQKISKQ